MAQEVDLYQTLTNIANQIMGQRELYRNLQNLAGGNANIGDEIVPVPANQLTAIKQRLTLARDKVKALAESLKVEVVYRETT